MHCAGAGAGEGGWVGLIVLPDIFASSELPNNPHTPLRRDSIYPGSLSFTAIVNGKTVRWVAPGRKAVEVREEDLRQTAWLGLAGVHYRLETPLRSANVRNRRHTFRISGEQ